MKRDNLFHEMCRNSDILGDSLYKMIFNHMYLSERVDEQDEKMKEQDRKIKEYERKLKKLTVRARKPRKDQ